MHCGRFLLNLWVVYKVYVNLLLVCIMVVLLPKSLLSGLMIPDRIIEINSKHSTFNNVPHALRKSNGEDRV